MTQIHRKPAIPNWFELLSTAVVIVSVGLAVLGTVENFHNRFYHQIFLAELVFSVFFVIEYVFRLVHTQLQGLSWKHASRYVLSFYGIIDLLCLAPVFFAGAALNGALLKMFRLLRILRIFKVVRIHGPMNRLGRAIYYARMELLGTLLIAFFAILVSATAIYLLENEAQPEVFSSIPKAFWWAVATMTTVGYGDIYPITDWGKLFAGLLAIIGIGLVAIPTSVITTAYDKVREEDQGGNSEN